MRAALLVGIGGFAGALLRYGVSRLLARPGVAFPLATLAVNVAGSLAAGYVLAKLERAELAGELSARQGAELRALLAAGLLGALTTFSTFGYETVQLVRAGAAGTALASVLLNLGLTLAAVVAGMRLAAG